MGSLSIWSSRPLRSKSRRGAHPTSDQASFPPPPGVSPATHLYLEGPAKVREELASPTRGGDGTHLSQNAPEADGASFSLGLNY